MYTLLIVGMVLMGLLEVFLIVVLFNKTRMSKYTQEQKDSMKFYKKCKRKNLTNFDQSEKEILAIAKQFTFTDEIKAVFQLGEELVTTEKRFCKKTFLLLIVGIALCGGIVACAVFDDNSSSRSQSYSSSGYWGNDGYYHPSQAERNQAMRDAQNWMKDNW